MWDLDSRVLAVENKASATETRIAVVENALKSNEQFYMNFFQRLEKTLNDFIKKAEDTFATKAMVKAVADEFTRTIKEISEEKEKKEDNEESERLANIAAQSNIEAGKIQAKSNKEAALIGLISWLLVVVVGFALAYFFKN